MRPLLLSLACFLEVCVASAVPMVGPSDAAESASVDLTLANYFRSETARLAGRCLADIRSLADWQARRGEYRRQLEEMLGLWPEPPRTELQAVVTGTLEQEDFAVEKIYFQAMPRLYVTANLYLPKLLTNPAPTILYVCGHSQVITNGVSCGNKAAYQHHGIWFARNGYVCLLIDTLQLGEIQGVHHGTYRQGQWWWNARGYTPAGVEAWFGIRALDYLCSRPEVDRERIGMTGRSGGGSYTWTVAALDERVKVAAPVAGITDLQNQVVDGAVEGHCDCMFFVNTFRWDFPQLTALLAPRPLLIANSDKDSLFPLDGVIRVYNQTRRIYQLYGATNKLGLLITDGPHADTQDLQLPVFRWFNRFLKGQDPVIEMAAKKMFSPLQLRVFDKVPEDQINTTIQEHFVPAAPAAGAPGASPPDDRLLATLREKVFAGWPEQRGTANAKLIARSRQKGIQVETYELDAQPGIQLQVFVLHDSKVRKPQRVILSVLDAESWTNSPARCVWLGGATQEMTEELRRQMQQDHSVLAFCAPRGVGATRWLAEPAKAAQVRRRFMLLGETLDSMRVWDIGCAVQALAGLPEFKKTPIWLRARGTMGVNAAYAALFEPAVRRLKLEEVPTSHTQGPDYLNVLKVWDIRQLRAVLARQGRGD
jgi:hypothetical protein